jgi:hypothetical protein
VAELRQLEFFLLRYAGDATNGESVNLGVVAIAPESSGPGFADVRFAHDWRRLRCFDPLVDTEELEALEREIRRDLQDPQRRVELLKRTGDAWSNLVRCEPLQGCLTESPAKEIEVLSSLYLETPGVAEKRDLGGRQRIVSHIKDELERAGVLPFMQRDISMSEYTRPGDPMKLDFGYPLRDSFKFLQAVSLRQRVDSGLTLAARFPQIAASMQAKKNLRAWLTAVVEDDLLKRDEVDFTLDMMSESGIVVARVSDMPGITEGIRLELQKQT